MNAASTPCCHNTHVSSSTVKNPVTIAALRPLVDDKKSAAAMAGTNRAKPLSRGMRYANAVRSSRRSVPPTACPAAFSGTSSIGTREKGRSGNAGRPMPNVSDANTESALSRLMTAPAP